MKNLFFALIIVVGSFQAMGFFNKSTPNSQDVLVEPLYEEPYVVVYGRDSCGVTQQMLADLDNAGIDYDYEIVDDTDVADELHERMRASGISTRRYNLPVVDVNGDISIRPSSSNVIDNS